ncbi:uncharacterized protein LOC125062604 [Pieris napi]|uniref:uncharacterized protein LOC125062604 n=1 Tax=Pieris napi TaxID=78633 RepID=UPI001FBB1A73|nr:uncharacterized protein LOC125062604 [Pieris napi]
MSSRDQEEQWNKIIRSMFVNQQPPNSPQRETDEEVYSNAPPSPELTIEYVRLRNDDDEVTDPEILENYIKTLRAESEAKKKRSRVDDDISTDELAENDDATDILDNRSLEEVRRRTASWECSPILQRFSHSPHHPALISKSISKPQRVSVSGSSQPACVRRSSRKRKKVDYRPENLSSTPERPSTSRQPRQKKVSRRSVNTRTIGTQTVDYWFNNMLMYDYVEYDIIPRQAQ